MANEITVTSSIIASKNGATMQAAFNKTLDMAGDQMINNVQIVGTTAETLVVGDVTTIGYTILKNLDATNYVEIDSVAGMTSFPQKLLPGEFCVLKPQTANIYAKANTASVNLLVVSVEL